LLILMTALNGLYSWGGVVRIEGGDWMFLGFCYFIVLSCFCQPFLDYDRGSEFVRRYSLMIGLMGASMSIFTFPLYYWLGPLFNNVPQGASRTALELLSVVVMFGSFLCGSLALVALKILIDRVSRRSIFDSSSLRHSIERVIRSAPLRIPTFICAAGIRYLHNGAWVPVNRSKYFNASGETSWNPDVERRWVPYYFDIRQATEKEQVDMLLASAALPFGLLPCIKVGSLKVVDGGIIDNVPIFPVIDESIDELFIVALEQFESRSEAIEKLKLDGQAWSNTDLLIRKASVVIPSQLTHEQVKKFGFPPRDIEPREAPRMPRMVLFYPKEPIGGFVDGTLNFNGAYARRLIEMGCVDAEAAIRQLQISASVE
jgi:hypothetical protein